MSQHGNFRIYVNNKIIESKSLFNCSIYISPSSSAPSSSSHGTKNLALSSEFSQSLALHPHASVHLNPCFIHGHLLVLHFLHDLQFMSSKTDFGAWSFVIQRICGSFSFCHPSMISLIWHLKVWFYVMLPNITLEASLFTIRVAEKSEDIPV